MKFSKLRRKLEKNGWYIARTAKHHTYVHDQKPGVYITVGKHGADEVPKGTLNKILKDAGIR